MELLQGYILGPLWFSLYINDLPNSFERPTVRAFADNTNITAVSKTFEEAEI